MKKIPFLPGAKNSSFYLAAVTAAAAVLMMTFFYANRPVGDGNTKIDYVVKGGAGSIQVAAGLEREGIVRSALTFRIFSYLTLNQNSIKKGTYTLDDSMSLLQVLGRVTGGLTKSIEVTFPEGYNNRQIGDALVEAGFIESRKVFLEAASDKELLKRYNIPGFSAEGYLFPETYHIPLGYSPDKIVEMMIEVFLEKSSELEGFPVDAKERHRLIILASIVEREAQKKEERALIAGVFHNRMEEEYPLESCATIQYLFEKPKKRLYYKDLEIDSPYNTYHKSGLPPGPISNPGLAAIEATLNPEDTKYKFFVVKGDGFHHFSETFQEHVRAKQEYILK